MSLPDTKTSTRHGRSESVGIEDKTVFTLLHSACQGRLPGDHIYSASAGTFRRQLRLAIAALQWQELGIQAYSFRRGGATDLFRRSNSMQQVANRGRWANVQTARLYKDSALQDRATLRIPNRPLMIAARSHLHHLLSP